MNKTRMQTTTEYIRKCEAALVVAPIARVETDSQVHKQLGRSHRMFGNKKALVVTKIDVNLQLQMRYLRTSTKSRQETRGLKKGPELEPNLEAAKEHERLDLARKFTSKEILRLDKLRNTAKGKVKETLTQEISKLKSVVLVLLPRTC